MTTFTPFLTFQGGVAEEALEFYCSVFPAGRIGEITRFPAGMPTAGKIMMGQFSLGEQSFVVSDSPIDHEWGFTPAISIFVQCQSAEELDEAFAALGEGGRVYMPIDDYGFSRRFGWVGDRYGITWQLNLA